jgi:hypothetical protein
MLNGFNQCSNLKAVRLLGIVMGDCLAGLPPDGLGRLWVQISRARLNEARLRGAIATFQGRSYDPTACLIGKHHRRQLHQMGFDSDLAVGFVGTQLQFLS